MRTLVGPTDEAAFDNPSGGLVFPYLDEATYEEVFDFGCGCGRIARQLIQQRTRPRRYVGIDLHEGMIRWCKKNLAPRAPGFEFHHHDVENVFFNPTGSAELLPFPVENASFTLVNAFSVFTHLTERQVGHYLRECARVLRSDGVLHSTWFLFDKRDFPMLPDENNALYISDVDPSAAVLVDREWVRIEARHAELKIVAVIPPTIRGYQWILMMVPLSKDQPEVDYPDDTAPAGRVILAKPPKDPSRIGL
jgi:SAM-dependent methyltransferase